MIFTDAYSTVDRNTIGFQLRVGGSADTGTNYRRQYVLASGASILAGRSTGDTSWTNILGQLATTFTGFNEVWVSNPAEATRSTAWRNHSYDTTGNVGFLRDVWAHDLSVAYDGFTATIGQGGGASTGVMTGTIRVYGLRES